VEECSEPRRKKAKKSMTLPERYQHFRQKSVVREKVVKVAYFQEQGLEVFLEKLKVQE